MAHHHKEKITKYLDMIGADLLKTLERHAETWEKDNDLDPRDVNSMFMTAMTVATGEAMAMALFTLNTKKDRYSEALEMGGEMIKRGAIEIAQHTLESLKDMPQEDRKAVH